jgi:EAL domain-containing protein (putative c-di-GMP-specific phosphodiesterase class I)
MGHSLNLKVVAEGVENNDQLDLLRRYSCDEIQGYGFSRPISGEKLTAMIADDVPTERFLGVA